MSRAVALTGAAFLAFALAIFGWKIWILGMPLLPSDPVGLWSVEMEVMLRDLDRGAVVRVALPSTNPGQLIFDERTSSDGLLFTIRNVDGQRIGEWRGDLSGAHRLSHGFRVQLVGLDLPLGTHPPGAPPEEIVERWGRPTRDLPSAAPELAALFASLQLPDESDPLARLRTLFTFVADDVHTVDSGSGDPLLTLLGREGSPAGKARLLASLLRHAGQPARLALGLQMRERTSPRLVYGVEAWIDGRWVPFDPSEGQFAMRPADVVVLRTDSFEGFSSADDGSVAMSYRTVRERLRPDEVASMMLPRNRLLAAVSLYHLPVGTQELLRGLLLLPLGALLVAVFRNLIGIPTFGTFLPILLALALRGSSLSVGFTMVGIVLAVAITARLALERLQLLLVPRLTFLLCLVVLVIVCLALAGSRFDTNELYRGVFFPMVILTMLAERFSIAMQEEGLRNALTKAGWTMLVIVLTQKLFQNALAAHLMFGFPELVFGIMGVLIWIGGYTGYRVSDLLRFRSFTQAAGAAK